MEQKEEQQLEKWAKDILKDNFDKFDFNSELDRKISVAENKTILRDKFRLYFKELAELKPKEIMGKEKVKFEQDNQLTNYIAEAEALKKKSLKEIAETETTDILERIFSRVKEYTKMVALGHRKGFLLYGNAGIGKTFNVEKAYTEVNKDFKILSGHITAMELYKFLFKHQDENIVLDDVNILETEQNLNLLKACLSENGVVSYHTSSSKLGIPSSFIFKGTVILLLNKVPQKAESLRAVESRILSYELKMTYYEKLMVMKEISKSKHKRYDLTNDERVRIMNWIKENTSPATENFTLRFYDLCCAFFVYAKGQWTNLARGYLKDDEVIQMIIQKVGTDEFCERTGKSERTYQRLKKQFAETGFIV